MYVLVCGSRLFDNYSILEERLNKFFKYYNLDTSKVIIMQGGAKGADTLAKEYAIKHSIQYVEVPAKWNVYGKSAGYKRNIEMLDMLDVFSDYVVAFQVNNSAGTEHTIVQAKSRKIKTIVFKYKKGV